MMLSRPSNGGRNAGAWSTHRHKDTQAKNAHPSLLLVESVKAVVAQGQARREENARECHAQQAAATGQFRGKISDSVRAGRISGKSVQLSGDAFLVAVPRRVPHDFGPGEEETCI